MIDKSMESIEKLINTYTRQAREVSYEMLTYQAAQKQQALHEIADTLLAQQAAILAANAKDLAEARENNLEPALVDRLALTEKRIESMAEGVRQIAQMPDPVGSISALNTQARGYKIGKMLCQARPYLIEKIYPMSTSGI